MDLSESIRSEISEFAVRTGMERVILFGSRAKGCNTDRSDIDLYVVPGEGDYLNFWFLVQEELNSLLMVDIVSEEECGEDLKKEVSQTGVVIYEKV